MSMTEQTIPIVSAGFSFWMHVQFFFAAALDKLISVFSKNVKTWDKFDVIFRFLADI